MRLGSGRHRALFLLALATLMLGPGDILEASPRRGHLTLGQLETLARSVGFTGDAAGIAARIAMRESGGNPRAAAIVTSPKAGFLPERSFGLWQVNVLAHPQYSEVLLLVPSYNARAAFAISKGGTDWSAWGGAI